MQSQCLLKSCYAPLQGHREPGGSFSEFLLFSKKLPPPPNFLHCSLLAPNLRIIELRTRGRLVTSCISPTQEFVDDTISENEFSNSSVPVSRDEEEEGEKVVSIEGLENQNILQQMKEIVAFTAPATGLWICGPLMSLIDTAIIGQGSSIELAALGPGTVMCDNMSYIFMFLSIATSNMVATSLARQDRNKVQHQLSMLLFIGLTCGFFMFFFTKLFGPAVLTAFTGSNNTSIVPAANVYVQIRGLAWPAVLVGWVAQSASLGMKDSWGPLKALVIASAINGIGDIVLCRFLGYGIAGAAWATMASQVVAAYMMVDSLNKKGYNGYAISIPSPKDLVKIIGLAAPLFLMMISKVAFYSLVVYVATSLGTITLAAHQVMIQAFVMCTVWGEPLCQTAQSFMPELMYGANRNLTKARTLLKSLTIIGAAFGLVLGILGTSVTWFFPNFFTHDQQIIKEMHQVLIPFFTAIVVTPWIFSFEGTLLAGRDLKFISLSTSGCFVLGALLLLLVRSRSYGLQGCWLVLVGFHLVRLLQCVHRLLSPSGILFSEDLSHYEMEEMKAA